MAVKDLALFKLVGSAIKKTKDKIVNVATHKNESDSNEESVQETFQAMLKKNKNTVSPQSDMSKAEESKNEIKEELKTVQEPEKATSEVQKTVKSNEKKVTKSTTSKVKVSEKPESKPAEKSTPQKAQPSKKATTTKEVKTAPKATAKSEESKPVVKKTTTKKVKPVNDETKTAPKKAATGTKREAKIKLYTADVQKHYGSVDDSFLAIVVKNLGPSIYRKDAELVSCSDPKELDTVRNNFLVKKLGFDKSEKEMLDGEIKKVCETLKGTRTKYRATFYYILAKNLKKESVLS